MVGWLSGVLFDERPPRVPVCISVGGERLAEVSSEFSSGRAVAPLRGRALPGLYAERTDYRLSTISGEEIQSRFDQVAKLV